MRQSMPASPSDGPTPERRAKGDFAEARTYEFEAPDDGAPARRIVRTVRDLNAGAATRLRRLDLTPGQRMAAVLFERDHELARLGPRMTADLGRIGRGGPGDGVRLSVLEARDRRQVALSALRMAGGDTVRLVEAVVLNGVSVTGASAGQTRYAHKAAAIAWAGTTLSIGLTLLEGHYRASGRL